MLDRVISADSHVLEPPDLWSSGLPCAYRDRAPEIVAAPDGTDASLFVVPGLAPRRVSGFGAAGVAPDRLAELDGRSFWSLPQGGWDPEQRIADQDRDGVAHEVLFPSLALCLLSLPDVDLGIAFRTYNDWVAAYASSHPSRLSSVALLPMGDPNASLQILPTARIDGMVGCAIPVVPPHGTSYADVWYDPVWAELEGLGLPVCLHVLTEPDRHHHTAEGRFVSIAHRIQVTFADMIFGGLFDRFPDLQVVSVEHDIAWIPAFLARLDRAQHQFQSFNPVRLDRRASEVFRANMSATFQEDLLGVEQRSTIGVDRMLWGSDYPHLDSTWPNSQAILGSQLVGVDSIQAASITSGNAARVFGLADRLSSGDNPEP